MKKMFIIPLLFLPILAILGAAATFLIPVRESTLEEIKWGKSPELIAVNGVARDGRNGLLMIRLKDGKEQFVAGDWKMSYTDIGNQLLLGEFPEGYSSTTGQHLYMVRQDKIYGISLKNIPNKVQEALVSNNNAYMAFIMEDGEKETFCVMEWAVSVDPVCETIKAENISKIAWGTKNNHELFAQTASGTFLSIDPWENGVSEPKEIIQEQEPDHFRQAERILADKPTLAVNDAGTDDKTKYYRFFNLALISDSKNWSIHRIPVMSDLYWLNDSGHLLIMERDRLGIYELKTRSFVSLLSESGIGEKKLTYRMNQDKAL